MAGPYHHSSAEGAAPIRVEIAWTRKSLASFMRHYYLWRITWPVYVRSLAFAAIFALAHWGFRSSGLFDTLLLGLGFFACNFVSVFEIGTKKGRELWDKNEIFQHPMSLTFTPTSLEIAGHDRKIVRSLDSFRGLRETWRAFLLTMSPDAFYVIPKSAFADDSQRAAFRVLVRGGVPKSNQA